MFQFHQHPLNISLVALLGGGIAFASAPAHALVFQFQFDNCLCVGDELPLDPPIVGSGSFSFDGDPGVGTFALTSLPDYTFSFLFDDGNTFGNSDIATPLNEVLVLISQAGNTYDLKFSNTNPFGGGPDGGSIDFDNSVDYLSFEPPGYEEDLDLYFTDQYFGNYSATAPIPVQPRAVPGPLPLIGVGAAFAWSRRMRRRIAKSTYKF
jgi:hypothetical protein